MSKTTPHTILMTSDTVGGVWNYSLILSKALQEYEVEVHLATMGKALRPDQWKEANKIDNLIIHESEYALEWMENPWSDIEEAGNWLLNLEQNTEPDLIHLNNYAFGNLLWKSPLLTVGHSCVLSWWKAVHREKAPPEWRRYASQVKKGLQQADTVIGITQNMLKELKSFYGPFSKSKVIYNAQEPGRFSPKEKNYEIFSMGRVWDKAKNIRALQQIASDLNWPVFIAGNSRGELDTTKTENLHFLGELSTQEVAERLSKSAIYVMPARYEPFGLSVLEAALSGCALVLGDIPTLRELWQDAALFANPDNPEELHEQINRLIHQPELREEMAGKAMDCAKKYSLQKMGEAYWKMYCELCEAFIPEEKNQILTA
ncbi:MAG: glycosyltransferase family 4 protein [Balneolaceae bacterium]